MYKRSTGCTGLLSAALLLFASVITLMPVIDLHAEPLASDTETQALFRHDFYQAYSDLMEHEKWYNAIGKGQKPELVIFGCEGARCLVSIRIEPEFNEQLYLVSVTNGQRIKDIASLASYGQILIRSAFVTIHHEPAIYIRSHTRMGTQAQQLFRFNGAKAGDILASHVWMGKKSESAEGDLSLLNEADKQSRGMPEPFAF